MMGPRPKVKILRSGSGRAHPRVGVGATVPCARAPHRRMPRYSAQGERATALHQAAGVCTLLSQAPRPIQQAGACSRGMCADAGASPARPSRLLSSVGRPARGRRCTDSNGWLQAAHSRCRSSSRPTAAAAAADPPLLQEVRGCCSISPAALGGPAKHSPAATGAPPAGARRRRSSWCPLVTMPGSSLEPLISPSFLTQSGQLAQLGGRDAASRRSGGAARFAAAQCQPSLWRLARLGSPSASQPSFRARPDRNAAHPFVQGAATMARGVEGLEELSVTPRAIAAALSPRFKVSSAQDAPARGLGVESMCCAPRRAVACAMAAMPAAAAGNAGDRPLASPLGQFRHAKHGCKLRSRRPEPMANHNGRAALPPPSLARDHWQWSQAFR